MKIPFDKCPIFEAMRVAWETGHYLFFFGAILNLFAFTFLYGYLWWDCIKFCRHGINALLYTFIVAHVVIFTIYAVRRYNGKHGSGTDL